MTLLLLVTTFGIEAVTLRMLGYYANHPAGLVVCVLAE